MYFNFCFLISLTIKKIKMKKHGIILILAILVVNVYSQTYKIDTEKSTMSWLGEKVTGEHYRTEFRRG